MGFLTNKTQASDDLLENGIKGTATVEKADMHFGMLGVTEYSGYMSQKSQEQLLTGEKSMSKYRLQLRVELPGREPYAATITVPVPAMKTRYMTGGSVVPVLVDPKKDDRMAIDWNGTFQQGTLAQMSASNPMIAAAMKGAGVDIDAITQQQLAAQQMGQPTPNVIIGGQLMGAVPQAPKSDFIDQIKRLAELRDSGVLTDAEFEAQKAKILAS